MDEFFSGLVTIEELMTTNEDLLELIQFNIY